MKRTLAATTLATLGFAAVLGASPAFADHLNIDISDARVSGATLTITSVKIDEPGFIVLHEVRNGEIVVPASIGHAYVDAGTTANVKISADMPLSVGSTYYAMLHYDTDGDGDYSFGPGMTDVDGPALNAQDKPYVKGFVVQEGMDMMGSDMMDSDM